MKLLSSYLLTLIVTSFVAILFVWTYWEAERSVISETFQDIELVKYNSELKLEDALIERKTLLYTASENNTKQVTSTAPAIKTTIAARSKPVRIETITKGIPKKAEPSQELLKSKTVFYNRVGKCGSRSLLHLVRVLGSMKGFKVLSSNDVANVHPNSTEVEKEMKKISSFIKKPTLYDRHIHYLDFKAFGLEEPIYINMIRDPIRRFSSQYNYLKYGDAAGGVKKPRNDLPDINECVMKNISLCSRTTFMFYIGSYFCGFDEVCSIRSRDRIELAKKHIDENYYAIGLTEEFENTIKLLEKMLPSFFKGVTRLWNKEIKMWKTRTTTKRRETLTEESIAKLKNSYFLDEYEVYNHGRKKFERLKNEFGIQ
uniref:uronyl 2-sulfotransferase-like n=1 Tax=Styela clava TaxID=7725 RepID=UPI001939D77A|nr:uronyl 2-sulfotransferase-like [Styela clava]